MAKKIHLRLIGQAEKFIDDMVEQGLTERDVIAKALQCVGGLEISLFVNDWDCK